MAINISSINLNLNAFNGSYEFYCLIINFFNTISLAIAIGYTLVTQTSLVIIIEWPKDFYDFADRGKTGRGSRRHKQIYFTRQSPLHGAALCLRSNGNDCIPDSPIRQVGRILFGK